MSDAGEIILEYVCPAIGVVLATMMFFAPYRDVEKAIKAGGLGELNPLPWVFMLGNCSGWVLYSFLTRDFFLFAGNISGLVLSIWFNLSASNLLFKQQVAQLPDVINIVDYDERSGGTKTHENLSAIMEGDEGLDTTGKGNEVKDLESLAEENKPLPPPITELPVFYTAPSHDYRVMAMVILWLIVFSVIGFGDSITGDSKELIVGSVTNFCLVFFYGAPLSCIAIVLQTKNTATLHVPTMFTNTASSIFWGIYGLGVSDYFVAVPNLVGALLGAAQIVLYMLYPRMETTSIPVITAAVPAAGANIVDGEATEMEIVQVQLHDIASEDLLGQSVLLGNTNAHDPANNPMNVAYATPSDTNDSSSNVTTLHKQEFTTEGINSMSTENPLVLQYNNQVESELDASTGAESTDVPLAARTGLLHRRTSSRGGGRLEKEPSAINVPSHSRHPSLGDSGSTNLPRAATVANVHHRRVVSDADSSFLAGLFASSRDIANLETTTTATLHRTVAPPTPSANNDKSEHED